MKKLLIVLAILAFIAGMGVMKAEAATSDTIAVTVTLAAVSVSVTPDSWAPINVTAPVTSGTFTATNDSANRTEDFAIVCSAGSSPWYIGSSAGVDTFVMAATGGDLLTATSIHGSTPLETDVLPAGTVTFTLTFTPPTTSTLESDSMTVTVTAS